MGFLLGVSTREASRGGDRYPYSGARIVDGDNFNGDHKEASFPFVLACVMCARRIGFSDSFSGFYGFPGVALRSFYLDDVVLCAGQGGVCCWEGQELVVYMRQRRVGRGAFALTRHLVVGFRAIAGLRLLRRVFHLDSTVRAGTTTALQ